MLDARSSFLGTALRQPPSNTQAESALLGALLANNKAYERVSDYLRSEHFADPMHGRIYQAISTRVESGRLADPVTLKAEFEQSGEDIGDAAYLASLLSAMVGVINATEYGRVIYDMWLRRQLIDVGEKLVNDAYVIDGEPGSGTKQIEVAEQRLFKLTSGATTGAPVTLSEAMAAAVEEGEKVKRGEGDVALPTGLPSLDKAILGARPGHLIVVAGRPGIGKTSLARRIAINIGGGIGITEDGEIIDDQRLGSPVSWHALEEEPIDFAAAAAAAMARVQISQVLNGTLDVKEAGRVVAARKRVADMQLFIDARPRQSLSQIGTQARRLHRKHGRLGAIVVDYLQLMPDPPGARDKRLSVGANAYGLKELAKELKCPVFVLSQLSRAVEQTTDKRPTMAHLRESGEIEDAADVVCLVFREEYYFRQTVPDYTDDDSEQDRALKDREWDEKLARMEGVAELILPKIRRAQTCVLKMRFIAKSVDFEEPGP